MPRTIKAKAEKIKTIEEQIKELEKKRTELIEKQQKEIGKFLIEKWGSNDDEALKHTILMLKDMAQEEIARFTSESNEGNNNAQETQD